MQGPREDEADRHRRRQGQLPGHDRPGGARRQARGAGDRAARHAAQDGRPRRGAGEGHLPADRSAAVRGQARAGRRRRRLGAGGGDPARRRDRRRGRRSPTGSPEFGRCRPLNKQKIDAHLRSGRIKAFMSSEVARRSNADAVSLKNGTTQKIPNDFVIACLGGELPNEFLKSIGVSIHKHHGDKAMANPALAREARGGARGRPRRASLLLRWSALLVVGGLTHVGYKYYLLPRDLRYKAPEHAFLKPSGMWGHGVGVLATMFMLLNFVYPLRKRLPWFKGRGSITPWLRFHVFVGIMSPIVILFHTAFQWGNQLATSTYVSVVVVVVTGLDRPLLLRLGARRSAGRLGGEAPRRAARAGRRQGAAGVETARRDARSADAPHPDARHRRTEVSPLVAGALPDHARARRCTSAAGLRHCRRLFLEGAAYRSFCGQVLELRRLRAKLAFHHHFKRLMSAWRALHVVLAIVLLVLIGTARLGQRAGRLPVALVMTGRRRVAARPPSSSSRSSHPRARRGLSSFRPVRSPGRTRRWRASTTARSATRSARASPRSSASTATPSSRGASPRAPAFTGTSFPRGARRARAATPITAASTSR